MTNTETTNNPLRAAFIGCGSHALRSHGVEEVRANGLLEIEGAYDPGPGTSEAFFKEAKIKNGRIFRDLATLLKSDIPAVFIMSPDEYHATQLLEAVKAGKHVFIEKPLISKPEEIEILKEALRIAKEKQLIVSSCHPRRFDPVFIKLKEDIPKFIDKLGKPILFQFDFSYKAPATDWKLCRSLLLDHANHEIDLMNYLFGFQHFDAWKIGDGPYGYQMVGNRGDRLNFHFYGTRLLSSRIFREETRIRFQRGEVQLNNTTGTLRILNHEEPDEEKALTEARYPKTAYNLRHQRVNENFIRSVLGIEEPYLDYNDLVINNIVPVQLVDKGSATSCSGTESFRRILFS